MKYENAIRQLSDIAAVERIPSILKEQSESERQRSNITAKYNLEESVFYLLSNVGIDKPTFDIFNDIELTLGMTDEWKFITEHLIHEVNGKYYAKDEMIKINNIADALKKFKQDQATARLIQLRIQRDSFGQRSRS